MARMWLWFPCAEERKQYVLELLELQARLEETSQLDPFFSALETGDSSSECGFPWGGKVGERGPVVEFSFRQLTAGNFYHFQPGSWLVLSLAKSRDGRRFRRQLKGIFPAERLGTNASKSRQARMRLLLWRVRRWERQYQRWLNRERPLGLLKKAYNGATKVFMTCPQHFEPKDAYLWEAMARHWEGVRAIDNARECHERQALLQMNKGDAWLNMGSMYSGEGSWGPAAETYLKGLRIVPGDPYITHNLSQILANPEAVEGAIDYLDFLVTYYPSPFHFLIAGDFYRRIGKNTKAAARYREGAKRGERNDRGRVRCLIELARYYLGKDYGRAAAYIAQALEQWPGHKETLELAVAIYSALEDLPLLEKYARCLVEGDETSAVGRQALARCGLALGGIGGLAAPTGEGREG